MSTRFLAFTAPAVARPAPLEDSGGKSDPLQQEVVALFDQFREPMLRYLCGFGLPIPDGEEVLQEVFLSLFQHLKQGKPRDNLRGWLFRVAHNLALKRRFKARRELESSGEAGREEWAVDPAPNPEDLLATSQTRERLLAVVNALPER